MTNESRLESPGELLRQLREASMRRRLLILAGPAIAGLLVSYHLILLWDRVVSQTLFEPWVALRWLATLALLAAAWRLRGSGIPLIRGRKALTFWLLVALLHLSFAGPLAEDGLAVPADGSSLALLLATPAAAGSLVTLVRRRRRGIVRFGAPKRGFRSARRPLASAYVLQAGLLPSLCRRPPPA